MQNSNIPSKIPLPFAFAAGSGYINPIPTASQIGVVNGRASLTDGFPPLTFTPIGAGGVPPFGGDMNGILNEITAIQQWQEAGGGFPYDSGFSTTIGGYPLRAKIPSGAAHGTWISLADNNTSNPDANGANWGPIGFYGEYFLTVSATTTTLTNLQAAYDIINIAGTLTANSTVIFPTFSKPYIIYNGTTGAYTLTAKTASGSGITLTQNSSTTAYCDGTNITFADSAKVASFNGRTGTVSLNATDVDNALGYVPVQPNGTGAAGIWNISINGNLTGGYVNGTSGTFSSEVIGSFFRAGATDNSGIGTLLQPFLNGSTAYFRLRAEGNGLYGSPYVELAGGVDGNLTWNGAQIITQNFFAGGPGYGYQKFPSGLIMQWVNFTTYDGNGVPTRVNFPIRFPSAIASVVSAFGPVSPTSDITTPLITADWDLSYVDVVSWTGLGNGACIVAIGW